MAVLVRAEFQLDLKKPAVLASAILQMATMTLLAFLSQPQITAKIWNSLYWIILIFCTLQAVSKNFLGVNRARWIYFNQLAAPQAILWSKMIYGWGTINPGKPPAIWIFHGLSHSTPRPLFPEPQPRGGRRKQHLYTHRCHRIQSQPSGIPSARTQFTRGVAPHFGGYASLEQNAEPRACWFGIQRHRPRGSARLSDCGSVDCPVPTLVEGLIYRNNPKSAVIRDLLTCPTNQTKCARPRPIPHLRGSASANLASGPT